jgi:hypothetical protein
MRQGRTSTLTQFMGTSSSLPRRRSSKSNVRSTRLTPGWLRECRSRDEHRREDERGDWAHGPITLDIGTLAGFRYSLRCGSHPPGYVAIQTDRVGCHDFNRIGLPVRAPRHYALWDDEAITALTAQAVLKTGDTSAVIGHNIVAFRNGLLLRNMKDRATPPLQFYLDAPFLAAFGHTAFAARLPFALCGLGTIALLLWWLHRDEASMLMWILLCLGILGNVSLFLFARQARYYGLAMFLSVAIAYSYLHLRTRAGIVGHAILSVLLLAANYMTFAAVSLAMALDYLIWGRKRRALRGLDWVLLFAPQLLIGAIVVSIWNPLRIAAEESKPGSWIAYRATLLWWNVRDLNACEFGVGLLLLAAPIVAVVTRSAWMLRAILAVVIGVHRDHDRLAAGGFEHRCGRRALSLVSDPAVHHHRRDDPAAARAPLSRA